MFNRDFFPTPYDVIENILPAELVKDKVIYEPSAGKGDIVDYCILHGAKQVIASELHPNLRTIVATKCKVIGDDFLNVTSDQISHIDMIVMNPPFSSDEKHILHAYTIAPSGCKIIALCNLQTILNACNRRRTELKAVIENYGSYHSLGNCFSNGERETEVEIALVTINKAGASYEAEFDGFFMEDEVEEQGNGIMSYNFVRDLVNRYVGAIKIYDQQLETATRLNDLTKEYFFTKVPALALSVTRLTVPVQRNEFKKEMQKEAWKFIFDKLNMQKIATRGLKEDINKFVEQQVNIPFTMRNIYRMLDIVIGTTSQRMDKAIEEVFDHLTKHYHDNRYGVEGWKSNSHYLMNQKFIVDWMVQGSFGGGMELKYNSNGELIEDMMKALCYITGRNYDDFISLDRMVRYRFKLKVDGKYVDVYHTHDQERMINRKNELIKQGSKVEVEDNHPEWGKWFDWGFFEVRGYKKGTMHFKFKDINLWGKFNQRVSKIKGYPLFESVPPNAKQKQAA